MPCCNTVHQVVQGQIESVFVCERKGRWLWLARVVLPMKGNLDVQQGRSIAIGSFPFRPGDETCSNSHRLRKRPNNRDSRDSLPLPAAFQRFPAAGIWSQPRNLALAPHFDEPCSRRFLRLWLIYKQTENKLRERWRRTEEEGGRERVMEKERETETGPQDVLFWLALASPLPLKKYYSNSFGSSAFALLVFHTHASLRCTQIFLLLICELRVTG